MKKKNYAENSEEDNEFDVDEPEEIQNNASDDDWTPDKDVSVVNIKERSPYLVHLIYKFMVKKGSFMIRTYSKTLNCTGPNSSLLVFSVAITLLYLM